MAGQNFTVEGRVRKAGDIQRNWRFELYIPGINLVTNNFFKNEEDLIIRVRSAVIPSRGNEPIESNFFGMKQMFPSKPTFGNTFEITIEEFEDQMVHKGLTAWQNLIYNVDPLSPTGGSSQRPLKRDLTRDVYLWMYKYDGTNIEKKVHFYNAFPSQVGDVTMDYTGNESVKFGCTMTFDFWQLQ